MASTGIILRRKVKKVDFDGIQAPIVGELIMATDTKEFGWLDDTNNVVWGRLENELPTGGNNGQVLAKSSGLNYEVEWVDVSADGYKKYRERIEFPGSGEDIIIQTEEGLLPETGNHIYKVYLSFPETGNKFDNYTTSLYEELEILVPNDLINSENTTVATVSLLIAKDIEIKVEILVAWVNNNLEIMALIDQIDFPFDPILYFIFGAQYIETIIPSGPPPGPPLGPPSDFS